MAATLNMRTPAGFVPRRSETRERRRFVTQILSFGGIFLAHFWGPFGGVCGPNLGPNVARIGNKTQPSPENRPARGTFRIAFSMVNLKRFSWRNANKKRRFIPQGLAASCKPGSCAKAARCRSGQPLCVAAARSAACRRGAAVEVLQVLHRGGNPRCCGN